MVKLRQRLGLVDEAAQAERQGVAVALGVRYAIARTNPAGQRAGQIRLQGDLAVKRMAPGQIDDAEATLAEHALQLEL